MSSSPATAPPPDSSSAASPPPATSTPSPPPPDSSASPPPESPSPPPPSSSPPPPSESPPPPLQVPTTPSGPSTGSNSPPEPQLDLPIGPPSTSLSTPQPETGGTRPPSTPSKPTHSKSGDHAKSNDGKSSDVSLPTVIGVSIGVGLFVVLMLLSVIICTRKKRKPRRPMHYYDAPGFKGGFYTSGSLPKWQNGGNDIEHNGNLPPPPGAYIPKEEGRNAQPGAPFPQAMFSSEMSSDHSSPRNNASSLPPYSPSPLSLGFNKSTFAFEELSAATSGFSENNLLGQGGFGYVFKGVLPNGKEIAVKQLKAGSGQGEREFQAEIEIISRVHHRHLVSLVGYCIAGPQRLLVYEFVPNRTLEYHLRGNDGSVMDWPTRLKIAIGSAKGLAYLHEDCHPRIIHRDIKSANILLDYKFDAKVADFGLAKLSEDTKTHVSTRIMGTFGYLAPEYASTGKLTEKSDVFSFGVLLLELITGRPAIDRTQTFMEDSLVDWAAPLMNKALAKDNYQELIDPRLQNSYDNSEVARMVASAAACVRHSARRRPKMSKIIRALEGDLALEDLNEGMKPGQSMLVSSSSDLDADSYTTNLRQFKRVALGSNDDLTEGYSGATTSEYGHNTSDSSSSGEMHDSTSNRNKNLYLGM